MSGKHNVFYEKKSLAANFLAEIIIKCQFEKSVIQKSSRIPCRFLDKIRVLTDNKLDLPSKTY
jgi:hypothetical protein